MSHSWERTTARNLTEQARGRNGTHGTQKFYAFGQIIFSIKKLPRKGDFFMTK